MNNEETKKMESDSVIKGLIYTKENYESLVCSTYGFLAQNASASNIDPILRQDMYGLYYCAFAGLIRSGVMCRRSAGDDGFPIIIAIAKGQEYSCPESVLYGIFQDEADDLITPYDDSCNTYAGLMIAHPHVGEVKEQAIAIPTATENAAGTSGKSADYKTEIRKMKMQYDEQLQAARQAEADARQAYETVKKQADNYKRQLDYSNSNFQPLPSYTSDTQDLESQIISLKEQLQEAQNDSANWQQKYSEHTSLLKNQLKQQENQTTELKKKMNNDKKEREKFKYNPDYDRYYSDTLPKIIDSINFSHTDITIRTVCAAVCTCGIILSMLFLI